MFLELIAVFVAGFAGAGAMMLVGWLAGNRLPRWLVPVAAGGAMLAAAIASEYGWYARTQAAMPEGFAVATTVETRALWRPWTHLAPLTTRFVAVDTRNVRANAQTDSLFLADLYFYGRWQPVRVVEMMIDCKDLRRADPALGDGSPPVWRAADTDDPIVRTVCNAV